MDRAGACGSDRRGFTMVEAMVALVIFGIGTIALLSLGPRATHFTARGRQVSRAAQLAQAKLEDLRARSNGNAELDDGDHLDVANPIDGAYTRSWTVAVDNPIEGMRRVEVRVSFPTTSPDSVAQVVTYF